MRYGLLNIHSEHSIKKSTVNISALVAAAKEKGYTALALVDINSMTGIIEFYFACKNSGIHAILGTTITISHNNINSALLLFAKDYVGFRQISRLLTDSYFDKSRNTYTDTPYITIDLLKKHIQDNHVIAVSAGIDGFIGVSMYQNTVIEKEIASINKIIDTINTPNDIAYIKNKEILNNYSVEILELTDKVNELSLVAKKSYASKIKGLNTLKDKDFELYMKKKDAIYKEIEETETAKKQITGYKKQISKLKHSYTALSKRIKKAELDFKQYYAYMDKLDSLKKSFVSEQANNDFCLENFNILNDIFHNDLYIELFNYSSAIENDIMKKIHTFAKSNNVPVFISNEINYINKDDVTSYQYHKSLEDNKWQDLTDYERNTYLMSIDESYKYLSSAYEIDDIADSNLIIDSICNQCNFELPKDKHYPKYRDENNKIVDNADELLRIKAKEGISLRKFNKKTFTKEYQDRYNYELDIIIKMGFADYLLIVADVINYAKSLACSNNIYNIGYGVGDGRGSSAGSLICYLLHITNVDPIKHNLKFERFLNENRVTMPDIDIDFSAEIRNDVIEYVKNKYGNNSVALIRTKSTQQAKGTIRNIARVLGDKKHNNNQYYANIADEICKNYDNTDLSTIADNYKNKPDYKDISEILSISLKLTNTMVGLGIHAAGVIIGDGNDLADYIPLFYNKNLNQLAIQCDKDEAENIGLLKMDFLILENLDIISETLRRIKKYTGETIDINSIPQETIVYKEIFQKGKTKSVFQMESEGMQKMLRDFEPDCFDDIVLLLSAYRPGPMSFIPDIISVKKGLKEPRYIIPQLEDILSCTYGYPIYQEQLMDIFSVCANFSQGEADIIRRYMSKKKTGEFIKYKSQFIDGFVNNGANKADTEKYWDSLVSFSEYAFNKSHSTAYANITYITAWLKYHYKSYYMCSVLNHTDTKDIPDVLYDCISMGIKIKSPDINHSSADFENIGDDIIYGLCKIKTVKNNAQPIIDERINNQYSSFVDFISRTNCGDNTITKLIEAGALDNLGYSRQTLKILYPLLSAKISSLKEAEAKLSDLQSHKPLTPKEKRQISAKITNTTDLINKLKLEIKECCKYENINDTINDLFIEYELLGVYASRHPLDIYDKLYSTGKITQISSIYRSNTGSHYYMGIVRNIKHTKTKKSNQDMVFFDLQDKTGVISVTCFNEEYEKYKNYIKENAIVKISATQNIYNNRISLIANAFYEPTVLRKTLLISIPSCAYDTFAYYYLKEFEDNSGYQIVLHYQNTGLLHIKNLFVNKNVLEKDSPFPLFIKELSI